jgi:hypothetical protein
MYTLTFTAEELNVLACALDICEKMNGPDDDIVALRGRLERERAAADTRKTRRVTREYYYVGEYADRREFDEMGKAVEYLYSRIFAGNYHALSIHRVTEFERTAEEMNSFEGMFDDYRQVTTTVTIQGPASLYSMPELSRYHPVNGWVVPETIEIND